MEETIAAISTGNTAAGIGVIRISGSEALAVADRVFKAKDGSRLQNMKGYRAKYGSVIIEGEAADEAVALVFRAPKSYTGEDVAEISVHGGIYVVEKTLQAVLAAGARGAEPGEFTRRAFLNGKMDLTEAESVANIISAEGEAALRASYNMLEGALYKKIEKVLEILEGCSANMVAWVDYPDDDIPELHEDALLKNLNVAKAELEGLLQNYDSGQAALQGIDTAIIGKPNVGKSTIMNLLSGRERSIVTPIEGTTRDVVEGTVRLGDMVLHLSDTAGMRNKGGEIENIGISFAKKKAKGAALILAVFDNSRPFEEDDEVVINNASGKNAIAVINKTDLENRLDTAEIEKNFKNIIRISAVEESAPGEIEAAVKKVFGAAAFDGSEAMLANSRQKKCCEDAASALEEAIAAVRAHVTYDAVNVSIDAAIDSLLSLTGKKATEEVINSVFESFCVGK